ncbi:hypothetical protein [Phytohabitans kaempferiae]|uniref:Uncharacterized protein n=1 Tax=Phytohabitans kaempferiae TaxID=1620943 RepID=A0ABV6M2W9_9ACTN
MFDMVVREGVLAYFSSEHWAETFKAMQRGASNRHLHTYAQSAIHPRDLIPVFRAFFENRGFVQQRRIVLHVQDRGYANIYNIHPRTDMPHSEVYLRFNDQSILEPSAVDPNPDTSLEYWDDEFMAKVYERHPWRDPSPSEEEEIRAYFHSRHWTQAYEYLMELGALHCHVPVWTSISPEALVRIGTEEIRRDGFDVDKAVAVVFNNLGRETGKNVYLSRSPDITLELEWAFRESVVIEPRHPHVTLRIDESREQVHLDPVPYFRLRPEDIEWLKERV